ncbi:hypothetical protein CONLIGDRAFT_676192 [Coniochaeta ligniaria NRRL 30616]|uniref:Uncharacterized protein n=1 Tax=Coniochaeta ligniaria NRRL 30616 TaxID=1408157 RepID=A0A1J7J7C8_9PEZI|nr:hypothetical protein CONLIGDRAFT_676192 [Coniochaeta ligniaria NRRL 30616]
MCREHVITHERCRHEVSERKYCLAADREVERVRKRTTWCCFTTPSRRVVCEVEYKLYIQPGFCDHCKVIRSRERAQQVRASRDEANYLKAEADETARFRQRAGKRIADNKAREKARQAAVGYAWKTRDAKHDHGDSYIENPLYGQVMNLLAGSEYQEYMPPPSTASRRNTRTDRELSGSKSQRRVPAPAPAPLASRRYQERSGPKPRGPAPAPVSVARPVARVPAMATHRRQMAGAGEPQLHIMRNGGADSRNQVVQDGGYAVPLPKHDHAPMDDEYGDPLPDDDFLDFVESSWK